MTVDIQQQFLFRATVRGPNERPARPSLRPDPPLVDESVLHDLLNPMTSIVGNLHLLRDALGSSPDPRIAQRLAAGLSSVEELSNMLVDLRRLMQVEAGELTIDPRPVEAVPMLDRVRRLEHPRATERQRLVITDCAEAGLSVLASEPLLERALQVLLVTALRVSRSSPLVLEAVGEADDWARFRFNYVGMRVEGAAAERLFTREGGAEHRDGPRIDRARGLVFARGVAESHGGSAWYEPTGDGGCFVVELPRAA